MSSSVVKFLIGYFLPLVVLLGSCFMNSKRDNESNKIRILRNSDGSDEVSYCDEFFFGSYFPRMQGNQSDLVKLCQTQQHTGYEGPEVYATLFNSYERIPVYSATKIQLYPNCSGYSRPDEKSWSRVSLTLCDSYKTASASPSRIGHGGQQLEKCGQYQALDSDYKGNRAKIDVDRGHLNPNAINCQDQENQMATFTLTNAAPQFAAFNENAWRQYECITEYVILNHVPSERVYIITGTWGTAKDAQGKAMWMNADSHEKNPVKIPGYYWKAVCYPGNEWEHKEAWGFAVIQENVVSNLPSDPDKFSNLSMFSSKYFMDDMFGTLCLDAGIGPIQNYFPVWQEMLNEQCGSKPNIVCNR